MNEKTLHISVLLILVLVGSVAFVTAWQMTAAATYDGRGTLSRRQCMCEIQQMRAGQPVGEPFTQTVSARSSGALTKASCQDRCERHFRSSKQVIGYPLERTRS